MLFEGVESFQRLLGAHARRRHAGARPRAFARAASRRPTRAARRGADVLAEYELDRGVLAVLTEYEEHRLRTHLEPGMPSYRLARAACRSTRSTRRSRSSSARIEAASPRSSRYLPSMDGQGGDAIELEMLLASAVPEAQLRTALNRPGRRRSRPCASASSASRPRAPDAAADRRIRRRPRPLDRAAGPGRAAARPATAARARTQLSLRSVTNGARRHPQARPPDEHRRRARHRAQRRWRGCSSACAALPEAHDLVLELHRVAAQPSSATSPSCRTASSRCAWCRSPGVRQARAWSCARSPRARQGGPPRHHRRRDRDRQADRRGAHRSADAHDPQRHRPRHRAARRSARRWASPRAATIALERLPEGQPRRHRGRGRRPRHRHRSACARRAIERGLLERAARERADATTSCCT